MRIHRVYISNLSEKKESYQIDKAQSVYLSKVLRLSDGDIIKFLKKLRDISVNACRQSLRNIVPEIIFKESMEAILETCDANKETQLIAFNTGDHQIIRNNDIKNKSIINLITGAESGFSSNEIQLLNNRNFIFRSLGSNILKAETAPIVSSSIIKNYIDCHK